MSATTDAPTLVNLAHHTYWNLRRLARHPRPRDAGRGRALTRRSTMTHHHRRDPLRRRHGFRFPHPAPDPLPRRRRALRYDTTGARRRPPPRGPAAARLVPALGEVRLSLGVHTTEPGIQVYTGGKLDVAVPASAAPATAVSAASPSSRRSSLTARTSRISRTRCCARARFTVRSANTGWSEGRPAAAEAPPSAGSAATLPYGGGKAPFFQRVEQLRHTLSYPSPSGEGPAAGRGWWGAGHGALLTEKRMPYPSMAGRLARG